MDKHTPVKKQPQATIVQDLEISTEQSLEIEVAQQVEEVKYPEEESLEIEATQQVEEVKTPEGGSQQSGDRQASEEEAKDDSSQQTSCKRLNLLSAIDMMNEIQGDKNVTKFIDQE